MKKDEKLKTIYEVIAPHVVRSENNWRDYLSFAARFHKRSFDNMLLVYAQTDDVTILATTQEWNSVGRFVNQYEKGIAVCVYENARMTLNHLFDISQTNGKPISPTDWQFTETMRREITARVSYSHGYEAIEFHDLLYALAAEAVGDHYEQYLQGLGEDIKDHLFSELPSGGFEAQFIQLLVDSVSYTIGKRCCLPDDEIRLGDGMRTISHFNTIPLIARVGNAVTAISKGILLELERTLKIVNKERKEHHEQTENRTELHRERRDSLSRSASVQRQSGRPAPGPVREDGAGIPPGEPSRPIYNFEDGWQSDGDYAPGTGGGDRGNRSPDPADAPERSPAGDSGHVAEDEASQQPQIAGGGNGLERPGADSPVEQIPKETAETIAPTSKEPSSDGSFFLPFSPDVAGRWAPLTTVEIVPLPFEEGLPSESRAAEMKEWLKRHGSRFTPTYTAMYHATGENIPVMEKGLLPTSSTRRRSYQSESGYVYLAATPERAKTFGDLGNSSKSIVYEVIVPVYKLMPDTDQLFNLRNAGTSVGTSIEESIVYAGGARIKGAIEQWQVRPFDYDGYIGYREALAEKNEPHAPSTMSDEEVRRHYEFILTNTDLYPSELHQGMREILADPPPDYDWSSKAPAVCALFSGYGNREYQGEVLYRTVLRGEDGISMYFGDGYTYLPWSTIANIVDAMIEDGDYPTPALQEEEQDPAGDFGIPDEIREMFPHSDEDAIHRMLEVVAQYEQADRQAREILNPAAEETQAVLTEFPRTDEDIFRECCAIMVPLVMRDEAYLNARHDFTDKQNAKLECAQAIDRAVMARIPEDLELYRHYSDDEGFKDRLLEYVFEKTYTDTAKAIAAVERIGQGKPKQRNDAPHRNYRKFEKLFPQIISGEYRYLRLESDGFMPLSVEWVYGDCISIMHTFIQDGDVMRDPDVVVRVDREEKTLQAVSFQQDGGFSIYQEVMDYDGNVKDPRGQRDINSFFTQWLSNISSQGYEPVRAVAIQNGEDVDIALKQPDPPPPQEEAETEALPELQIKEESQGAHHGQVDMLIQAIMDDLTVGVIEYSIFEDAPHISNMQVLEGFRRQGIATQMIRFLQERFPNTEIEWGMLTDDGAAFKDAVTYSSPNEQYERVHSDLADISKLLQGYEADLDAGKILSPNQAADMDDLSDTQYRLEKELRDLRPQKNFVRLSDQEPPNQSEPVELEKNEEPKTRIAPRRPRSPRRPAMANFRYSSDYNLYPSGEKPKYRNNIEAIKMLQQLKEERRRASPEEQVLLARYVGWGGLANAFSDKAPNWQKEYQELKLLVDEKEYREALNSTITAYYTEPELIKRIYTALMSFGFTGGTDRKILDPAMATGNFYSVLPDELVGTKLFGVELDSLSGQIAGQLYPGVDISLTGFENPRFEDNSVDIILGNIPFNNIKVFDKLYKRHTDWHIHDYFFGKSLDLLKPGGLLAFITTQGTLDKTDKRVREYIAARAEFVGAVRLPNNTFKQIAGTEVTTDLIFLKKRERVIEITDEDEFSWINTDIDRKHWIHYNSYYFRHPEMVLGEMQPSQRMYGREDGTACIAPEGYDLYANLDRAIASLQATFEAEPDRPVRMAAELEDTALIYGDAPEGTKNFTFHIQDDEIFYCEKNKLIPQQYTGKKAERIKGLCEIRSALLDVIGIQSHEYDPADLSKAQERLNVVYDAFVKSNGPINGRGNILAFSDDDQFPLLRSIEDEVKNADGSTSWKKSAVFSEATIKPYRIPTHADTAVEALHISMGYRTSVDLEYMSSLTGKSPEALLEELGSLVYLNPQKFYGGQEDGIPLDGWEIADEYLTGRVGDKLTYARHMASEYPELFSRNVEALEAVQPEWLGPGDISVQLGVPWIPLDYYRQFIYELLDTPQDLRVKPDGNASGRIDLEYADVTAAWHISNISKVKESVKATQTHGTKRINGYQIIEASLNLQFVTVRDRKEYEEDGKTKVRYVVNAVETMVAREKQSQIKARFSNWIWEERERRDTLLKIYNETFNSVRPREYDGSHLVFQGMNEEMELRPHQRNFAARVIYDRRGLAAHEVGAGKTAALLAAGMYMKQIGAVQKPIYVVPNSIVGQWAMEFYRFFPQANLLVATLNDFTTENRNRFVSKIAMNDYDGIIIAHSQFERIPVSVQRQMDSLNNQISQLTYAIDRMKQEKGENWSVKQMVIFQQNLEGRLKKLSAEDKKDDLLTFEQLGVDMLFADEAHVYKNCFTYTKMRNIAGVGQASSQRAFDMLLKCQFMQEINNGKGVVFATGTPLANSISEMFVMQRFLEPEILERMGLMFFDSWAQTFGEVINSLEIKPEGSGYRLRQRFARFHNLPELMTAFRLVADIQTAEMLGLPTPAIEGGQPEVVPVEPTAFQRQIMDEFAVRAERIRNGQVKPYEDNMLKLTGEARLMAIDPRLVYDFAPNDPDTKLNCCIEDTYELWEQSREQRLTQLVFCDSGTPKPGKFNVYDEFKRVLLEKGVPEDEIAFIHDAHTDPQRQALFEKVRRGDVRIILGSTEKLGTGVNVQDRVFASHDLDCPWRPLDITQRAGRSLRQGNQNEIVKLRRYVTIGTFDAYLWQIQEQKLRFISQIMTGKSIARSCEDIDEAVLTAALVKAVATDNPMLAEKMEVENEVMRLQILKSNWQNEQSTLDRSINTVYPERIAHFQKAVQGITADQGILAQTEGKDFSITIDGQVFDERVKAGERLFRIIRAKHDWLKMEHPLPVGEYRGLPLSVSPDSWGMFNVILSGSYRYEGQLGQSELGSIARIENLVDRIPRLLDEAQKELANYENQLEEAKREIGRPFEFEQRLVEYLSRQSEINTKLEFEELKKQEEVIMDDEDGNRPDGEENWIAEGVPSRAYAEI